MNIYQQFFYTVYVMGDFMKDEETNRESRPLGITILAIISLFPVFAGLYMIVIGASATFFGEIISEGWIIYMVIVFLNIYLVYGYIKLSKNAWYLGMVWYTFGIINCFFKIKYTGVNAILSALIIASFAKCLIRNQEYFEN